MNFEASRCTNRERVQRRLVLKALASTGGNRSRGHSRCKIERTSLLSG